MSYEISIYQDVPWPIWLTLAIFAISGIYLTLRNAGGRRWPLFLLPLVLAGIAALCLPLFKGYYSPSRHDMMEHIGHVKDFVNLGYFTVHNGYPMQHLFPGLFARFSGLPANVVAMLVMPTSYLVYIAGMWISANAIFKNKRTVTIVTLCASLLLIPISGTWQAAHVAALCFPLAIGSLLKAIQTKNWAWVSLAIILGGVQAAYHPSAAAVYFLAVVAIAIYYRDKTVASFIVVALFFGIFWILQKPMVQMLPDFLPRPSVEGVKTAAELAIKPITFVLGKAETAVAATATAQTPAVGISTLFLKRYGGELVFLLSAIGLGFAMIFNGKRVVGIVFMVLLLSYLAALWHIGINRDTTNTEFLSYLIPASIMIVAPVIEYASRRRILMHATVLVMVLAAMLGFLKLYPSPYLHQASQAVSQHEMEAARWMLANNPQNYKVAHLNNDFRRLLVAELGVLGWHKYVNATGVSGSVQIPKHFNYTSYNTLGEQYGKPIYVLVTRYDRYLYTYAWKCIPPPWTEEELKRLDNDTSTRQVYFNTDADIWLVEPLPKP